MRKKFNADVIMEHLCKKGVIERGEKINDLLKSYFPSPTVPELVGIRTIITELVKKEYIYATEQYYEIGNSYQGVRRDLNNVEIYIKLRQDGFEYCQKKKRETWKNKLLWILVGAIIVALIKWGADTFLPKNPLQKKIDNVTQDSSAKPPDKPILPLGDTTK